MNHRRRRPRLNVPAHVASAAATAALVLAAAVAAEPAVVAAERVAAKRVEDARRFLRIAEDDDGSVALEIASRKFKRPDGTGPVVSLVGVSHIGDAAYYRAVQELLAEHDLVLYESVKPRGAGGAGGETDEARRSSTTEALSFAASIVELHRERAGGYPADLATLKSFARTKDARLADFLDIALRDAWDRPVVYARGDGGDVAGFRLTSYGADGAPGGEGPGADINVTEAPADALGSMSEDGLQLELARALALSFQLDAIDYDAANWRCSDMSLDQVERALTERGSDFTLVESTLAGSALPAKIARFVLGLVRMADAFTDGAASDMIKVLVIEMLSDEAMIEQSLEQFGPGFADVIIGDRNQVVVDDLSTLVEDAEGAGEIRSVAVLYGAGHMADLAERMREQLGYEPGRARWLRAIEVNLERSAVSEAQIRQLRLMVRRTMRQMEGMRQRAR